MEFLLWLWLYDKRWLFGFRPNIYIYCFIWLIPILINISVFSFNAYFITLNKTIYQYAMLLKSLICFFSLVSSFFLIKNLLSNEKSENHFIEKIKDFYYFDIVKNDEYWISRNSLLSFNGLFLLFISLCQIIWSIYYIKYGIKYSLYVTMVLKQSAFIEIYSSIFILIMFGIISFIKVSSFISLYLCPNLIIYTSTIFNNDNHLKLNFNDIETPYQEVEIE